MILRITVLAAFVLCAAQAVLNKDFKRREAFDNYGPPPLPRPEQQYGPPQRAPHREYGVPQQIPFREYGPPALKYGPPKLNFISGSGSSGGYSGSSLHEQIKTHFGVPKPHYGPPHKPYTAYGPPQQPQLQYGAPPKPAPSYGPPPQVHRPQPSYGPPPKQIYGPPPQALPLTQPSPVFKPEHQPASSYGPPPSGPIVPKPVYGAPQPPTHYGPPQLPVLLPNTKPGHLHRVPETTIVLSGGHQHNFHNSGGSANQVQIQIDAAGHTHSVSGSQAPFHTACDGWKPIPAPVGTYVENNNIETQGGYSQIHQGVNNIGSTGGFTTQYSSASSHGSGHSIVDGLTDEQLVAIALQSDNSNDGNDINILPNAPSGDFHNNHNLNSIEAEALQLSLGSLDDSYSKPPTDSFAPGSVHSQKFNSGINSYGPPPSGGYLPPHVPSQITNTIVVQEQHQNSGSSLSSGASLALNYGTISGKLNYYPQPAGSQPSQPVAYRPPVPQGLLEAIGASVTHLDQFGVKPPVNPPTYIPPAVNEIAATGPGNLDAEYGPPPPPQALPLQSRPPQDIIEQQLPQLKPAQVFVQVNQQNQQLQQQQHLQQQQYQNRPQFQTIHVEHQRLPQTPPQFNYLPPFQEPKGNVRNQYGPPPPAPLALPALAQQNHYLVPPRPAVTQLRPVSPPRPASLPNQQYLPPTGGFQHSAFTSSASASALNEQFVHAQGLPLEQGARFNHVHDCGHGPNLIGSNYQVQQQGLQQFQQQQQQHQQQHQYASATSNSAYSAISQSIPVGESHTQFVEGPSDSHGLPTSGNGIDHDGYASQKSSVTALPDGTDPQDLPGLNGLNVISAQKSHSIEITPNQQGQASQTNYQLELINNKQGNLENVVQHEEVLSQGLLQSILSAIEQPKQSQQQHQQQQQFDNQAPNHNYGQYDAQSRSDIAVEDIITEDDNEPEPTLAEPASKNEVKTESEHKEIKENAIVQQIQPIVPQEVSAERK